MVDKLKNGDKDLDPDLKTDDLIHGLSGYQSRQYAHLRGQEAVEKTLTDEQKSIAQRVEGTYQHGLTKVDPFQFLEGRSPRETDAILRSTTCLPLSGFCRGNCRECGQNAKPYTSKNKVIFEKEPLKKLLIEILSRKMFGDLLLYDDSDPLDHPDIIEIVHFLEGQPYLKRQGLNHRIKLLTSCPPGTEEVLKELFSMDPQKVLVNLSILPSTEQRLKESGALNMAFEAENKRQQQYGHSFFGFSTGDPIHYRFLHNRVQGIGRLHKKGTMTSGFNCSEGTVFSPVYGPCAQEHHLATDMFPTERKLIPVDECRRVYVFNEFSKTSFSPMGFYEGPIVYTPHSTYHDLDTHEFKQETALRHIAVYLYSILENICRMRRYTPALGNHFVEDIEKAMEEETLTYPENEQERVYYLATIQKLLIDLCSAYLEVAKQTKGYVYLNMDFQIEEYKPLIQRISDTINGKYSHLFEPQQ